VGFALTPRPFSNPATGYTTPPVGPTGNFLLNLGGNEASPATVNLGGTPAGNYVGTLTATVQ
jgi:hypothetical protein